MTVSRNSRKHTKIRVWWQSGAHETEIVMHEASIDEATVRAKAFGYRSPKWYKPWQYITGGLGVITVDYGPVLQTHYNHGV